METITLAVQKDWIELQGVSEGCFIQKISGAPLYYIYSARLPTASSEGFLLKESSTPDPLRGGRIFVKSRSFSRVVYAPANVDATLPDLLVGDLDQLETTNKENVVVAINELNQKIEDLVITSGAVIHEDYLHTVTTAEIANKELELNHLPVRSTVRVHVYQGTPQLLDVDYTVDGQLVKWSALAMELLLEVGTVLQVTYRRG